MSSLSVNGLSFSGLASGIDTNSIITGMLALQQAQITTLQNKVQSVTSQQTAFDGVETDLTALQTAAEALGQSVNGAFDGRTATASDPTAVSAAAGSTATPGVYSFTINQLAQAQQVASQGFSNSSSTIAEGTYQLQVGTNPATSISIDDSNDTLQGLANAINNANGDVSASIINTGQGNAPYELLLTSTQTGAANTISLSFTPAAGGAGSGTEVTAATVVQPPQDASITIGSGPGALTVTNSSNQVNDLINGVTLNLLAANPNQQLSVTVANDASSATTAVQNFVSDYNAVISNISTQTAYNATTQTAGQLLGNSDIQSIQSELASTVTQQVAGLGPQINTLSAVGVSVNSDGTLSLNTTTLNNVLSGQVPGVSIADVKQLFALSGQGTNNGIQFLTGCNQTQSSATPYGVTITQAATQGTVTGTDGIGSSISIDSSDNTIQVKVNGQTSDTLTLATGSYTPQQLAQQLQTLINNDTALAGNTVSVAVSGSNLQITSQQYGANSSVAIVGGSAVQNLGLTDNTAQSGQNVAGYFTANGAQEQATGQGQILTGNSGNANTDGLAVNVTLSQTQVQAGDNTGNVTVTQGIASGLDQTLSNWLNPTSGLLQTADTAYKTEITNVNQQITQETAEFNAQQTSLEQQFAQMEVAISQLKTTGLEIAALTNSNNSNNSSSSSSNPLGSLGSGSSSSGSTNSSSSSGSSGSTSGG